MQDKCILEGCEKTGEHDTCSKFICKSDKDVYHYDLKKLRSVKNDTDKPDLSLLTPELVEGVARVRQFGAKKYGRHNNRLTGFSYCRTIASVLRHVFALLRGEDNDPESGLPHEFHAICGLEQLALDKKYHPEHDDRYKPEQK
jgi:hypothetical protein